MAGAIRPGRLQREQDAVIAHAPQPLGYRRERLPEIAIQRLDRSLVALRLDMSIGVRGLTDSGVPELPLDPPDVRRPQATRGG